MQGNLTDNGLSPPRTPAWERDAIAYDRRENPSNGCGLGTLFALAAGLMWGLVFIAPLLLPEYPAALLSFGRYLAFGLIALPLAWLDRARLAQLTRADWIEALQARRGGQHRLLPVPGQRHPARRRAAADDDHRHAAGGHRHQLQPARPRGATASCRGCGCCRRWR